MNEISSWWSIREALFGRDLLLGECFDLKNDEDKVKAVLKYLLKYEKKPLDIYDDSKNVNHASMHIERANENLKSTTWQCLLKMYNQAIIYAPSGSNELAQAYACRSAVLYTAGLMDSCRMDIERALEIGCPDHLQLELNTRKEKCLSAMKMRSNLDSNENTANKMYIDGVANETFIKSLQNKLNLRDYFIPEIPKDNCQIIHASEAVELKHSERYGRQVIATRNIEAGEALLVHKAYASIIEPHLMHKYCWYCSKHVCAGIPCHQCVSVIYCNEFCRDRAWQEHHDIECSVIAAMLCANMEIVDMMSLRLTVKAYKEFETFEKLKENLDKIDAISDPVNKCLSGDQFDSTKYATVYSLWRDFHDDFSHALKASIVLYFLAATTTIFGEKIHSYEELLNNEWAIFIGGLIMRHVAISIMNCVTMCIDDDNGNSIDRGGILNPFISLFNHSCDPMVIHYVNGEMNALISLQRIKKGEQIFYDYGSSFWDESTNERRDHLLDKFGFLCECKACINNWGPHSRLFFSSRRIKSWPAAIEGRLSRIHAKYPSIMSMVQADNVDKPLIISTTFDMINIYQQFIKYYTREIFEFKALLHVLYYSVRC